MEESVEPPSGQRYRDSGHRLNDQFCAEMNPPEMGPLRFRSIRELDRKKTIAGARSHGQREKSHLGTERRWVLFDSDRKE
jgi:hypothetical protein